MDPQPSDLRVHSDRESPVLHRLEVAVAADRRAHRALAVRRLVPPDRLVRPSC